jgi:hypothetical protein
MATIRQVLEAAMSLAQAAREQQCRSQARWGNYSTTILHAYGLDRQALGCVHMVTKLDESLAIRRYQVFKQVVHASWLHHAHELRFAVYLAFLLRQWLLLCLHQKQGRVHRMWYLVKTPKSVSTFCTWSQKHLLRLMPASLILDNSAIALCFGTIQMQSQPSNHCIWASSLKT